MKRLHSIVTILLNTFCIIYLLLFSWSDTHTVHHFSTKVSAKTIVSEEHNTLSESFILSPNKIYQKNLSAHDTFFVAVTHQKAFTIEITSQRIKEIDITLLSDTGKNLSYDNQLSNNTRILSFSDNTGNYSQRIFIKILNSDTISCSFQIRLNQDIKHTKNTTSNSKKQANQNSKNKKFKATEKTTVSSLNNNTNQRKEDTENKTSAKTDKKQATSNSQKSITKKQKLSTIYNQKVILYPQFILTTPGSVHKLTPQSEHKNYPLSDFKILSSNSSIAVVKNNKVYTLQSGIAILYLQNKKNPANTTSCFIKVINEF